MCDRRVCYVDDLLCLNDTLQVAHFSPLNRWRLPMKFHKCGRRVVQRDTPEYVAFKLQH